MSHRAAAGSLTAPGYRLQNMPVGTSKAPERKETAERSVALARVVEPDTVAVRGGGAGLEAAFLAFLHSKALSAITPAVLPIDRRVFLTMAESAEFSGLPAAHLRRLIASRTLKALKTGAGWRVARIELEKLSMTLTETEEGLTEHELRDMELNRLRRQGNPLPPER